MKKPYQIEGKRLVAVELPERIDSVKHLLWHRNVAEALNRMADMFAGSG